MLICNQPLGSSATLLLFLAFSTGLALLHALPARSMSNLGLLGIFYFLVCLTNRFFGNSNMALFALYSAYLSAGAVYFMIIRRIINGMTFEEIDDSIAWILALDLCLNVPPVLLQVAMNGIGDFVGGLSGLFSQGSLSQGRTNTVRAGMLLALALTRFGRKNDFLGGASALFNMTVLIIALSMTALLSAFGAGMVVLLFGKKQSYRLVKMVSIAGVAVLGAVFNQMKYGVSYSDYILALGFHFEVTPKLNIYKYFFTDLLPAKPWMALFGDTLGNFMSRFTVLFNFENYSNFPFKSELSGLFESQATKKTVIDRYHLENGIMGGSIMSVPWNGILSIFIEMGLVGVAAIAIFLRSFVRNACRESRSVVGSGLFLITFFAINMAFDVYMDFPEVLFPFFIIGLLMGRTGELPREGSVAISGRGLDQRH